MALNNYTDKFISLSNLNHFWSKAKTYIADVMLAPYAKTADVTSAISTAVSDAKTELTGLINGVDGKLAGYYTKGEVDGKVTALEGSISGVDAKFAGYYTKGEVDGKVTTINGEIERVEGLFAGYTNTEGMNAAISAEGKRVEGLVTAHTNAVNTKFESYSTTEQVEGLIAAAQAADKADWEAADSALEGRINTKIGELNTAKLEIAPVGEGGLPSVTEPKSNVIYLVAAEGASDNVYVEWIYVDSKWERIGTTAADLSNYYTKGDVDGKVTALNASIEAAAGKGDQGIADAAAALAAAEEGQRLAGVAQGEVDALEGVVAELTTTVGNNKTAAEAAVKAVEDKIGAGFDASNTVAKAIDDINTAIENAVAGGVNSVTLKNTDLGKALDASGAGNITLDIADLVSGYTSEAELSSAVSTLEGKITAAEGKVTAHESAVDTWAASIQFANDSQIDAWFA